MPRLDDSGAWSPVTGLIAASAVASAAGLADGHLAWTFVGVGCALAWAGLGAVRFGRPGLLAAVPALALAGGGWWALAGWVAAALAAGWAATRPAPPREDRGLRALRAELRDVEHERELLHHHIQRYPVLLESCLELSGARDRDQLAAGLVARVRQLVPGVTSAAVFLASDGRADAPPELVCHAACDADGRHRRDAAGIETAFVAREARPLIRRQGSRVRALVPLRSERRRGGDEAGLHGALVVEFTGAAVGDRMALELLGALGRLGGLGLAAVDLLDQARSLALRDELTGLFGRHEFLRRLDEAAATARRHQLSLGLLMCDLDHLKHFNDRHGHAAGDAALRAVAEALRQALPGDAILGRCGGEEFAAVVTAGDRTALAALAERARAAIAAARPDVAHADRRVTASLGTALLAAGEDARAALARADAALYAAKAAGRDRVESAP